MPHDPYDFDVDVDLSAAYNQQHGETLISSYWYELAQPREGRPEGFQKALDRVFKNAVLHAQWCASSRRKLDRRRALRVPLLSRIHVDGGGHLVSTDISMSGLRCSGRPTAPVMDVEFKLPQLDFPIDARVEVVTFKDSNVIPLVGMRFAWIDKPYIECITQYIAQRRERLLTPVKWRAQGKAA